MGHEGMENVAPGARKLGAADRNLGENVQCSGMDCPNLRRAGGSRL